jgi:hypothetical protein
MVVYLHGGIWISEWADNKELGKFLFSQLLYSFGNIM